MAPQTKHLFHITSFALLRKERYVYITANGKKNELPAYYFKQNNRTKITIYKPSDKQQLKLHTTKTEQYFTSSLYQYHPGI